MMQPLANRFDTFINNIKKCTSADELAELISCLGLFKDDRDLYSARFSHCQIEAGNGGLWQEPLELATALWSLKDELCVISELHQRQLRFVEIGTFTGYTFFVFREFIKAHVTPNLISRTFDPYDCIMDDIKPWIESDIVRGTSLEAAATAAEQGPWDIVFIDGCHEAPWPLLDFERLHANTHIVLFHDIVDGYCPDVVQAFKNVSMMFKSRQVTLAHRPNVFGIGIVYTDQPTA